MWIKAIHNGPLSIPSIGRFGRVSASILLLLPLLSRMTGPVAFTHAVISPLAGNVLKPLPKRMSDTQTRRGHSHNDYHQTKPLTSALKHGIKSIEVDVFPRGGELFVGHTFLELDPSRTLGSLYLQPILRMLTRGERLSGDPRVTKDADSRPFPSLSEGEEDITAAQGSNEKFPFGNVAQDDDDSLTLLIDIKADPETVAASLHKELVEFRPYLSMVDEYGNVHEGRLKILISGKQPKPESLISEDGKQYMFIDGRAKDIHSNTDTKIVPLVSLPWRYFMTSKWLGRFDQRMQWVVAEAHKQGKLVRVWGVPNDEKDWKRVIDNGVDYVSVDDHPKFSKFSFGLGKTP